MENNNIVIRQARIIDPNGQLDLVGDLLIAGGEIVAAGRLDLDRIPEDSPVIDGTGLVACPGFIDLHCHLREPGFEYKETIAAGSKAGAKGGFTTLCAMPNTDPPIDNA
ncbi:MAG: amidohydrolase family protein, partial [Chloroflexota bacterium]|nr:amidohydrolase family protein [Chloroflexota bacterium]